MFLLLSAIAPEMPEAADKLALADPRDLVDARVYALRYQGWVSTVFWTTIRLLRERAPVFAKSHCFQCRAESWTGRWV